MTKETKFWRQDLMKKEVRKGQKEILANIKARLPEFLWKQYEVELNDLLIFLADVLLIAGYYQEYEESIANVKTDFIRDGIRNMVEAAKKIRIKKP